MEARHSAVSIATRRRLSTYAPRARILDCDTAARSVCSQTSDERSWETCALDGEATTYSVAPDLTSPSERAIDCLGDTNGKALETAAKGVLSVSLNQKMDVIALRAEMQKAKTVSRCSRERSANRTEHP